MSTLSGVRRSFVRCGGMCHCYGVGVGSPIGDVYQGRRMGLNPKDWGRTTER